MNEPLPAIPVYRRGAPPQRGEPARRSLGLAALLISGGVVAVLVSLYVGSHQVVWLDINDQRFAHRTHERTARGVLAELDLPLLPEDVVIAPSADDLLTGMPIRIQAARQAIMYHDGSVSEAYTLGQTVIEALDDLQVIVLPEDRLYLLGDVCELYTPLPPLDAGGRATPAEFLATVRRPFTLRVQRAVTITLVDDDLATTFPTTARTVGEALFARNLRIYEGDIVSPGLDALVRPGLTVHLTRATPVVLEVGGEGRQLRTHTGTVGELLIEEGVTLQGDDYIEPSLATPVGDGLLVRLVRVVEERYVFETPVAYQVVHVADPNMEIDTREMMRWGREGARRQSVLVRYENGREVVRTNDEEWIAREPLDRIINYGTKLVLRELNSPHGTFTYWRVLRMLATSYNAPTAGTPVTSPWYGLTRLGWQARKGLVAVDPRVISLRQELYVPGYGPATAADTGGAILWRRIDLCYDVDNLVLWNKWVDVHLLTPAPPRDQILWQVPNVPAERS